MLGANIKTSSSGFATHAETVYGGDSRRNSAAGFGIFSYKLNAIQSFSFSKFVFNFLKKIFLFLTYEQNRYVNATKITTI